MKRALSLLVIVSVFAASANEPASAAVPAGASEKSGSSKDPRKERDRVRREKAKAAARLDALRSDERAIDQALETLAANVTRQHKALEEAQEAQRSAEVEVVDAERAVDEMSDRISQLEVAVKDVALRAFTSGTGSNLMSAVLAGNPGESAVEEVLFELATGNVEDALDELHAAHDELTAAQRRAERAVKKAEDRRDAVEDRLADLDEAIEEHQTLSEKVDERIDETLAEAESLEQLDAELSKEISRQIKERERAIAARQRELAEKVTKAVPQAKVEVVETKIVVPAVPTAVNGLMRIGSIVVDAGIGPAISALVSEAANDGIALTGGGFRSAADQIATRRANCGSSTYDIWSKPPSQCRPPAARPGRSMHEKGLAVDFACNGQLISNYRHWCYGWISRHAPKYGLKNRRGEAWHWSTNGN
jgi:peptidoglycan hydrolase CwlO-like protein